MKPKKPEKELHTHDSIPCYTGEEQEGCVTCIKNKVIEDMEAYYEGSELSKEEMIKIIRPLFRKDELLNSEVRFIAQKVINARNKKRDQ